MESPAEFAAAAWLRERATSYYRDAEELALTPDEDDCLVWSAAYRTIATELREAAEQIERTVPRGAA